MKIPKVIGHRGACGYAPENTLESIKAAADIGCTWVELDVKLTKDSVAVIFHDDELDRCTNGHGPMAEMLYRDVQSLEAGSWYAESFAGIKIPTLEEAIDLILELDLGLNLEIKPCAGREVETAEVALDVLSRVWDDPEKLIISSFQHVSLETCLDMAPDWKRGLLMDEPLKNWPELAKYLEAFSINFDGNLPAFNREMVEAFTDAGYATLAYTINDPIRAKTLYSWGVDGVFSDTPDVIEGISKTRH
ncbi:MAG: glycerophosphoryl diester phosphodiesterase [Alphaproteobacteria bacterium]|nr:glycerophosphoryl diester phosphodiesterase [Alphaproteobacteria bacterium]